MFKIGNPTPCTDCGCDAPPCDNRICVSAWSMADICSDLAALTPPDCSDPAVVPGGIGGAAVTITRSYIDSMSVVHTETVGTCATDSHGRCCVDLPLGLADPEDAPTVDPDGGGASGCQLTPDTYRVAVAYRNSYPIAVGFPVGETRPSPDSEAFQVGIPDPQKFPVASALAATDTGGRVGSLAAGIYWFKHTYADLSGETVPGAAVKVRVGMLEPTTSFALGGIGGGGTLAAGNYDCYYAATDGVNVTTPHHGGTFGVATLGDVYGLTATPGLPALPDGCTGWTVWLSDDFGATWHLYLHNVATVYDSGLNRDTLPFSTPMPTATVALPGGNTFPELDPRVLFPADMASLRARATEQRLYVSKTSPTVGFRRYATGIVGGSYDCLAAFPVSGAASPTTNTADRNIPRVSFTPGGAETAVYARSQTPGGGCKWWKATTGPKNLSGTPDGSSCPNALNNTRFGDYLVTVQPADSLPGTATVTVNSTCFLAEVSLGFCNYRLRIDATDHDSGAAVTGWGVAEGGGSLEFGEDGVGEVRGLLPVESTVCAFYASELASGHGFCWDSDLAFGVRHNEHHLTISVPGYWDRCVAVDTPCGVPAVETTVAVDLYSTDNWVRSAFCCGDCTEVALDGLIPEMLPRVVHASFVGPEAMTGGTGAVSSDIAYNPTRSAAEGQLVYDAMVPAGGWSYCMNAGFADDYLCLRPGFDPYDPCGEPFVTHPNVVYSQHFYGSARLTWRPRANACKGDLTWENFWGSGPGDDTPPTCAVGTFQGGLWCEVSCACGEVRPDGHSEKFAAGTYDSKTGSTSALSSGGDAIGPTTTGTTCAVVNWTQAQNPVLPPAYDLCPDSPPPVCSGTVTES